MGNIVTSKKKNKKRKSTQYDVTDFGIAADDENNDSGRYHLIDIDHENDRLRGGNYTTLVANDIFSGPRDFRTRPLLDLRSSGTVIDDGGNNGLDNNPSPFSPSFLLFTTVISSTRLQNNIQ